MRTNGSADGLLLLVVFILLVSAVTSSWGHEADDHPQMRVERDAHERWHQRQRIFERNRDLQAWRQETLERMAREDGYADRAEKEHYAILALEALKRELGIAPPE